ncbi:MAG: hypothetical protein ACWA5Q_03980 [bacterium]
MRKTIWPAVVMIASLQPALAIEEPTPGNGIPGDFLIMTPEEATGHREKMGALHGIERENYRNQQYQLLRERARNHGYVLPPTPVWKLPDDPRVHEMELLHERQRATAEAHREQMRQRFDEFMARQPGGPSSQSSETRPQFRGYWPYQQPGMAPPPPPPPPGYWRPW